MSSEVRCFLDDPKDALIDECAIRLRGWIAASPGRLKGLAFLSTQAPIPLTREIRPEVEMAMAGMDVFGFCATLRMNEHAAAIQGAELIVYVLCASRIVGGFRFRLTKRVLNLTAQCSSDC